MSKSAPKYELKPYTGDMPLPEHVINCIENASMIHVDLLGEKRLYCVRDWVYWVSKSKATNRSGPWSDLKKSIEIEGGFEVSEILRVLEIATAGGKQRMEFTTEEGLYQITQRMADRSKAVRDLKTYLAQSGVYMGEAYRNPGRAFEELYEREIKKLLDEGFTPEEAQQWLQIRHLATGHQTKVRNRNNGDGISKSESALKKVPAETK